MVKWKQPVLRCLSLVVERKHDSKPYLEGNRDRGGQQGCVINEEASRLGMSGDETQKGTCVESCL